MSVAGHISAFCQKLSAFAVTNFMMDCEIPLSSLNVVWLKEPVHKRWDEGGGAIEQICNDYFWEWNLHMISSNGLEHP